VSKAVPSNFQKEDDAILLLWPVPRGEEPNPDLKVPFSPAEISNNIVASEQHNTISDGDAEEPELVASEELSVFGSSEYAKVVLGGLWGCPPALDLEAEADLHTLLQVLAKQQLLCSARDISDGGIAVALAQAGFEKGIGAKVEQDPSLMEHPLFGLFAEPATTMILSASAANVDQIQALATEFGFLAERIGTTGGDSLTINVYRESFIHASLESLRKPWADALETTLHGEVSA